jgi:hypothetical protein
MFGISKDKIIGKKIHPLRRTNNSPCVGVFLCPIICKDIRAGITGGSTGRATTWHSQGTRTGRKGAGKRTHHSHAPTHHTGTGTEGKAHSHSTTAKAQRQGHAGAGYNREKD